MGFFKILPLSAAIHAGRVFGRLAYFLIRHERKRGEINLTKAGFNTGEKTKILKDCFASTGEKVVQAIHAKKIIEHPLLNVVIEGEELFYQLKEKGGVVLTAHMGNWELMGAWAASRGLPLTVIARPLYSAHLSRWVMEERKKIGMETVYTEGITSLGKILKALKNGKTIAILADANPKSDSICTVHFFNQPLKLAITPFRISLKAQLAVVALFYKIANPFTFHLFLCKMEGETPEERARFFAMQLEDKIRQRPEEWIWWLRQL